MVEGEDHRLPVDDVNGKDGKLDFAIVIRDGNMVMMGRPVERMEGTAPKYPTARPVHVYVYVKDVDAYHTEVNCRSFPITEPLTTQWWGDRNFAVKDPCGYTIWFCQTVGPSAPPPPGVTMV
jgi:uncharacterized glyoxalase superfamily protein PhnB